MDAVYFYKHSNHGGAEIHYSLRSLAKNAPYIRKVWIFGDCPFGLSKDKSIIEHVPHSAVNVIGAQLPVQNFFLLHFLSSLIPGLSEEYLRLSDDFIILQDFPEEQARQDRIVENLSEIKREDWFKSCPNPQWRNSLEATFHYFKRCNLKNVYNFETHVPTFMTKARCMNAYLLLKDAVTEHRWTGLMGATAILNTAPDLKLSTYGLLGVFQKDHPLEWLEANEKQFFNFDDPAFGPGVKAFLNKKFPDPCKYENL